ncbi:mitochondrial potassium channel isoform X2 [Takifugu flavidus]|uniref:mitochondrial potassium channel isoform X2 n=1 Tax=Takifugu flavidus TaxID=433684 RepID=UPI0025441663|nr:mitochondrial potassium channel isoform X2 [Takifugu flavidus]XP_056885284.1 mitochondrial potassium channel isoform X2 [Takifugu flavidus]
MLHGIDRRFRGVQVCLWARGSCCASRLAAPGKVVLVQAYCVNPPPGPPPPSNVPAPTEKSAAQVVKKRVLAVLGHAGDLGQRWGQRSAETASASLSYWWARYEEFVGLNEVREAQTNVTQAESAFMVARGMVREAHAALEALQVRLKEVRDRLDRVSREEAHYLELATLEHKLLQEERRLRTAYENAEGSEREKFALFSAAVRESHEKERTRAERTKNWSIIGSVLGALIGVMGSTYINRVRLQELKGLLLEAQKGPESLQEALRVQAGNHRSQQEELRTIIDDLRLTLSDTSALKGAVVLQGERRVAPETALKDPQRETRTLLQALPPQMGQLRHGLSGVQEELAAVRKLLESKQDGTEVGGRSSATAAQGEQAEPGALLGGLQGALQDSQRTLGGQIRRSSAYNAVFSYTAATLTVCALFLLLRGSS